VLDDGPLYSLPDDTDDDGNDDPLPLGTLEPDDGYDEPALDGALEPDDGADDEADDGTDEPLDGALPLLGVADDWLGHDSLPDGVLDDGTDEPLYSLLDGVDGTLEPELGADEPLDGYDEPDDGTDEPLDGALPLLGVADDWLGHDSDDDDGDEALPLGTLEPPDDGPLYSLLENEPDDGTDEPLDGALEAELGTDDSPLGTLLLLGVADDWLGNDSLLEGVLDGDEYGVLEADDGTDDALLGEEAPDDGYDEPALDGVEEALLGVLDEGTDEDAPLYSLLDGVDGTDEPLLGYDDPLPLGTLEPDDGTDEPLDGYDEPDDGADDEADDGTDEPLDGALPLLGVADDWLGHDSLPDGVLDDGTEALDDAPLYSLLDGTTDEDGTDEADGLEAPEDGYDDSLEGGTDEELLGALDADEGALEAELALEGADEADDGVPLLGVADDWLGNDSLLDGVLDEGVEALLGTDDELGPLYSLLEGTLDSLGVDEPLDGYDEPELGTDEADDGTDEPLDGALPLLGVADDWLGNDSLLDGVLDDGSFDETTDDDE
jgi:hypothetical protein